MIFWQILKLVIVGNSGKITLPPEFTNVGKLGYIVQILVSGLEQTGIKLTLDRGYSSPTLFDLLAKQGIGAMGTVNTNRKGFATELVQKGGRRGDWTWLRAGNLFAVRWYDSNQNYFISNFHYQEQDTVQRRNKTGAKENVNCTKLVADYSKYMNGVDKCDQNTVLDKSRKQYRWHMRVFLKAIEWAVWNSYCLYTLDRKSRGITGVGHRKIDLLHFRKTLIIQLIGDYRVLPRKRKSIMLEPCSLQERLNRNLDHFPEVGETKDHTCRVCMKQHSLYTNRYPGITYADNPCKVVKTSFRCSGCHAYLCIKRKSECWRRWHSLQEYWRPMPWEHAMVSGGTVEQITR